MTYRKIKSRVHEVIEPAADGDTLSRVVDIIIIGLIVINTIMVIVDTFDIPKSVRTVMNVVETVSVIVFTIEYIVRVWTADLSRPDIGPMKSRVKYVFSFQAIIDLVALLPFYLPFLFPVNLVVLRVFRVFRLLRLFKVNRYTHALATIGAVFRNKANQLISSMLVVALLMVIASVLMYNVEHDVQPEVFDNALSGLWWAVATLTTVGYGDIYPITPFGKILSAVIALLGIGLVAVPTGIITSGFSEQIEHSSDDDEKQYCPFCGKKLN